MEEREREKKKKRKQSSLQYVGPSKVCASDIARQGKSLGLRVRPCPRNALSISVEREREYVSSSDPRGIKEEKGRKERQVWT